MSTRVPREDRGVAIAVGTLYILATAAGIAAMIAGAPTEIATMATGKGAVLLATLFELVMAVAVAGIALMLYPILVRDAGTRVKQGLALWYVGTRITEGGLFLVGIVAQLSMLSLSRAMAGLPAAELASYEASALSLKSVFDYSWIAGQSVFCVGAMMLYSLTYASKRVPRWLSLWGLVGAPLMLASGFLTVVTGDPNSAISSLLYAPMAFQELALALWLLVRGFYPNGGADASAYAASGGGV